ncbi:MAG: DUF2723 domain-containing protein [Caldilineaceae bacterium]|nr:DUF2723 domain-containing protein [Caldilineaceae bacterium]
MSRLRTYGEQLLPWLVWLAFFLLYALTAAPSIAALFDDTLEFNLVLPTFGIAHPTGYPLYTVLGGLWTWLLPVGNWAWRTNLFSAVTAAATVALVFVLTRRLTRLETGKPDLWAGLAAAVVFGLGLVWWAQATVAEVYALHNLLVAAMLVTAIAAARTEVGNGHHTSGRPLALLFLLLGLGLAHHRTVVLLVPGLAIYLLLCVPGIWRPRPVWALWLGALFLPLLLYAYIPLRAAAGVHDLNNSYTNTWDGFWNHVLARGYTGFFAANALAQPRSPASWLALWLEQMGWAGVLLTLGGLAALRQRTTRSEVILLLIVLITNLLFALVYQVSDQEVFLIPAFMVAAVLAGYGLAALRQASRRPLLATSIGALALVLLLWGPGRGPTVDRSQAWAVHDYAVDMAKVAFPPGSRVIGIEGELTALRYMQEAEGLGLAATPVVADDPAVRRDQLAAAVAAGAPAA